MGTYEHRGGTAAHDPAFDQDDGITELEDSVLGALEDAQEKGRILAAAMQELSAQLGRALAILVREGAVIDRLSFGSITVAGGNARGAQQFEIAGPARLEPVSLIHPELAKFLVDAWPLNADGKRLSGRAGNSSLARGDTVTLSVQLCQFSPDEALSGNDLLMKFVARAACAAKD